MGFFCRMWQVTVRARGREGAVVSLLQQENVAGSEWRQRVQLCGEAHRPTCSPTDTVSAWHGSVGRA